MTTFQPVLSMNVHPDKLFFGESGHGICRYDTIRYPILDKIDEKMKSFFWRPQEIDFSQEKRSFGNMTDAEQFIFTSNLKRQILLDSIQGRAPALTFLEHCTDPTLENAILTWSFFESIHSASYTYILRAIYPNPAEVVDDMPNIRPIVDCAHDITKSYDRLRNNPNKENLYLALISANALEAIRFYVSFACTFAFMERGMVEASAKTIKMIARDENMHLVLVQHILKLLPQDDPEFVQIIGDNRKNATQIFMAAAEQEKEWARYLFENGTMLGLNEKILSNYIDYLLPRRMKAVKLVDSIPRIEHPLPWIEKHFTSENSQVAPQEVELSSYLASSVRNDLGDLNLQDLWVQ